MSEIDSGGPMFPSDKTEWVPYDIPAKGITIRQWFAGMALQGMMDNDENVDPEFNGTAGKWGDVVAKRAYQFADAMLRAGKVEK